MKEQLPGGNFYELNPERITETSSVIPHNKLPERAFGMLDYLIRIRLNATTLTNEAFNLFAFNKTSDWLEGLPQNERDRLLNLAKKKGRQICEKYKERMKEIERQRLETLKKKQEELVKKKERLYKKKEKQTSDIIFYGLWQTPARMEQMLHSIQSFRAKKSSHCTITFPTKCIKASSERQSNI